MQGQRTRTGSTYPPLATRHPAPQPAPRRRRARADLIAVLQSDVPAPGRAKREYLHYYKLTQLAHEEQWRSVRLRGPLPPLPARRVCHAVDQALVALCSADEDPNAPAAGGDDDEEAPLPLSQIGEVRALDLSDVHQRVGNAVGPV